MRNRNSGKITYTQGVQPTEELIAALRLLEKLKRMGVVKQQPTLAKEVNRVQTLFASTLTDFLGVGHSGLTPAEIGLARENQRIAAIKSVRERTACSMTEAKELVDRWQRENGINPCGGQR